MLYCKDCSWSGEMHETMKETWKDTEDHCPRCGAIIDELHKPKSGSDIICDLVEGISHAPATLINSFVEVWTAESHRGWDEEC